MRPLRILTLAFLLFTLTAAAQTDRRIEEPLGALYTHLKSSMKIMVQMPDGTEGYTRNGNFEVSANGILQTRGGLPVLAACRAALVEAL